MAFQNLVFSFNIFFVIQIAKNHQIIHQVIVLHDNIASMLQEFFISSKYAIQIGIFAHRVHQKIQAKIT